MRLLSALSIGGGVHFCAVSCHLVREETRFLLYFLGGQII